MGRLDSDTKAIEKLKASRAWAEAEKERLKLLRERDETYRTQLQKWLNWTFGNLHRASNRTTFYYLVWTPTIIFWTVMITSAVPNAIACPKPDGICHNTLDDGTLTAITNYSNSSVLRFQIQVLKLCQEQICYKEN